MENMDEQEITFDEHELIVSMTDVKGKILYINDIFCKIAGYERLELIGQAHNIIRHDDMPKIVFKLLWETILGGKPITAFVKNRAKNGNFYWVKAYIAPIIEDGEIVRFVSYRRPMSESAKQEVSKLYSLLLEYENNHTLDETSVFFDEYLGARGLTYAQLVDRLALSKSISSPEALQIDVDGYYIDHIIFKTNIVRSIALGKKDVAVVEPCCCNFGKKLKALESMPFTLHPSWGRLHQYHEHVHALMKEYVVSANEGTGKEELDAILHQVDSDTEGLLSMLRDVINTYVEE